MSRFGDLVKGKAAPAPAPVVEPTPAPEPVVEEVVAEEPVRARDESGHFIADDPSTPENEAWVGGVAPKTSRKSRRSRRSKKSEE
jgi:hypothetical protein